MDFDGSLKEIPANNNKDYAIQYIVPTATYIIIKIERDQETNDKRYFPLLSENKLNTNINSKFSRF